jgi:hypothetical protein
MSFAFACLIFRTVSRELMNIDHPDVFLFLMHFDSLIMKYPSILSLICSIAKVKWIHILASSDKINGSLGEYIINVTILPYFKTLRASTLDH